VSWIKLADYRRERRSFAVVTFNLFLTDGRHPVRPPLIQLTIPRFVVTVAVLWQALSWKWSQPDGRVRVFSVQRGCDLCPSLFVTIFGQFFITDCLA
jgi:hypothetical protein